MGLTPDQLGKIAIYLKEPKLSIFSDALNWAMAQFDILGLNQQAAFIAQVMHESGGCKYVREIASGSAYEGRKDLGNTEKGDGVKFKGRGLIQITGRANYTELGLAFKIDLVNNPELLEEPEYAAMSAAWFWNSRRLNRYADGTAAGFITITKRINGGTNGLKDRRMYWELAKKILC
jgi:putative chitinase